MKNSRIEWIGEIPDSWELQPLRGHLIEVKESNDPIQTRQVLSLTNKLGVIPYEEKGEQGNKSKENYNEYKLAYPNTIVANSMNILIGSVGICNYFGCVSPVYYVFKPNDEQELKFLDYIFQSQPFQKELRRYAKGILEIRLRVSANDILRRQVAFPASQQQKKIADFLEAKLSQVDELIANQEKQIEKLKEYKQSVITEAVTKGLDKSAPMKDSGIEWIGGIPTHWGIKRAKFIANSFSKGSGITKEDIVVEGDSPCVRYGEIYTKYDGSFDECFTRTNLNKVSSPQYFSYGDILFVCTGELVEEIGKNVVYLGKDNCLAGGDIIVMKHKQNPLYLSYALNSYISQCQKSCNKAKLKVVHISAGDVGNVFIAIPSIEEQANIANFLKVKCDGIDRVIAIKQEKIEKLQEYKKSLIYEYVTGKKEVV
mgnify:CR=1 FL=1